jgi:hypothetical protein
MAGATAVVIPPKSQAAILEFSRQCYNLLNSQWSIRTMLENVDRAYMREKDYTETQWKAKLANRYGDPTKYQNVTVPVVLPAVEAAVTYQSSVFLTGQPMFGWVGGPENESAALMYQAIMEENQTRGGWVQELMMTFRDGFKYNLGIVEATWDRQVSAAIETAPISSGGGPNGSVPKEVIWEGNCIKRWDPYNTFWDTRVYPVDMATKGEFCGRTEIYSRVALKKLFAELPDKMVSNIQAAFESGVGSPSIAGGFAGGLESYYVPQLNPDASIVRNPRAGPDWMAWAGMNDRPAGEMQYRNLYEVTTLYARIIPQDFNLRVPAANTPQVWKFIIVNHQVLVYCERQTNAHNLIPCLFMQPNNDGLGYQTKSLATNAIPFQDLASALVNSAMAAKRRAISDRGIYNPLLISAEHINNDSPVAKIPMRPGAYGKTPQEAYYPIPFRDDQSANSFQEMQQMLSMANTVNGQNQAKQGQFTKGNRTQAEYESVMANANGRDQICSMLLEAQLFTPLKQILKINTMQYQAGISLYSPAQERVVKVDPVALRKSFVTFKISDGLTPTDKLISADAFQSALQAISSSPTLGAGYNVAPAFSYLMKTQNVDLTSFEKSPQQVAYEQAMSAWQQTALQISKTGQTNYPPQPTPQQYGYTPGVSGNSAPQAQGNPVSQAQGNYAGNPNAAQLGASAVPAAPQTGSAQ